MEKPMESTTNQIVRIGDKVQVKPCAKYYPNFEGFYNDNKTKDSFPFYLNFKVNSMMKGKVINIAKHTIRNVDVALINIDDKEFGKRTILVETNALTVINNFKFKVGDKVRKICKGSVLMAIGDEGIVTEVFSGTGTKELLKIKDRIGTYDASNFEKVENEETKDMENLNEKEGIKIGDKVVRVSGTWQGMKIGDVGTVKSINYLGNTDIELEFIEFKGIHSIENMIKLNEHFDRNKDAKICKLEKEVKKLKKRIIVEEPKEIDRNIVLDIADEVTLLAIDVVAERIGDRINVKFLDTFGNTLAKGSSKKHPNDEFNLDIGLKIAMTRAIISYQKKQLHKFINKTR